MGKKTKPVDVEVSGGRLGTGQSAKICFAGVPAALLPLPHCPVLTVENADTWTERKVVRGTAYAVDPRAFAPYLKEGLEEVLGNSGDFGPRFKMRAGDCAPGEALCADQKWMGLMQHAVRSAGERLKRELRSAAGKSAELAGENFRFSFEFRSVEYCQEEKFIPGETIFALRLHCSERAAPELLNLVENLMGAPSMEELPVAAEVGSFVGTSMPLWVEAMKALQLREEIEGASESASASAGQAVPHRAQRAGKRQL